MPLRTPASRLRPLCGRVFHVIVWLPAMFAVAWIGFAGEASAQQLPNLSIIRPAPEQPLPFSHKKHAAQGLECAVCHPMPDPGVFAEIAGTEVCMGCHVQVKTDSPAIQALTAAHRAGKEIDWTPVYVIADFVYFSHRKHLERAKVTCAACHGDVASMDAVAKEFNISMAGCMQCHRETEAPLGCSFCHETRGAD